MSIGNLLLALPGPLETEPTECVAEDRDAEHEAEMESVVESVEDGQRTADLAKKLAREHAAKAVATPARTAANLPELEMLEEDEEAEEGQEPDKTKQTSKPAKPSSNHVPPPHPMGSRGTSPEASSSAANVPDVTINSSTHKREYMRLVSSLKELTRYVGPHIVLSVSRSLFLSVVPD